jgi:hypothetical protein
LGTLIRGVLVEGAPPPGVRLPSRGHVAEIAKNPTWPWTGGHDGTPL